MILHTALQWQQQNKKSQVLNPYLALLGELWGDLGYDFGENLPPHDDNAL